MFALAVVRTTKGLEVGVETAHAQAPSTMRAARVRACERGGAVEQVLPVTLPCFERTLGVWATASWTFAGRAARRHMARTSGRRAQTESTSCSFHLVSNGA